MKYGRYQIVKELGRGAMGVVYQAHDPQIDRLVALKVLRQDRVSSEDLVKRFLKEAKAIGRLSHPNIVTVYDVGQDHDTIYIAMEYLEGQPLNEPMREKKLPLEQIVNLGVQVAQAVGYAHKNGVVHRDIKPTNIILTPDGQVKITDFGIARIEDPTAPQQTQAGEILGTPVYMSPEQVMGHPVDGRSDLYSLGVILYEQSVGKRPFGGNNLAAIFRAITQDAPEDPASLDPSIPQPLSRLIVKSLSKEPDQRFNTGKEMSLALKACLQGQKTVALPPKPSKPKSGNPGFLVTVAFLVLCAVGGLTYYLMGNKNTESPAASLKAAASATLTVESNPLGAQVFVDGSFQGRSPLSLELPGGKHEVRLSLPEYYEWEAQLTLKEKGKTPLFVRLIPMDEDG